MKVEYVGTLETAVPSAAATGVKTGTVLTVSETEAKALLMVTALWKAADAEAEAVTPAYQTVLSSPQSIGPFNPAVAYTGGVMVEEAGVQYRSLHASEGETPSVAVHCWQALALVTREGVEGQLQSTPAESSQPNLSLGESAGVSLKAKSASNTLYGPKAGMSITTGKFNTAYGIGALEELKTGSSNTAIGNAAGNALKTGSRNAFLGENAGFEGDGSQNTYVGASAGEHATGSKNVFIGYECGSEEEGSLQFQVGRGTNPAAYLIRGEFSAELAARKIAFLGAEPVARAAHPTTLAEVITILKNLGFCE